MERNERTKTRTRTRTRTSDATLVTLERKRERERESKQEAVLYVPADGFAWRASRPAHSKLEPLHGCVLDDKGESCKQRTNEDLNSAKGDGNLFNVEFIDEDGTRIEATLWREVASKYFEVLEEGKVTKRKTRKECPNFHTL